MIPSNTIKHQQADAISKAYRDWINAGNTPQQLPGVGSGHILTATYSLRQRSNDEYAKKGKFKEAE